jgi:hypothetical protein
MNIKEFAALKAGDRIVNPMAGTAGTVTYGRHGAGITVRWDGSELTHYYSVVTTAWTHWTRADAS